MSKIIKSIDPSTNEVIGEVASTPIKSINKAVCVSREAQGSWEDISTTKKVRLMYLLSKRLREESSELVRLINKEVGKPKIEAEAELFDSIKSIEYYSEQVAHIKKRKLDYALDSFPYTNGHISFVPHGVIGLITPWNYPLSLPIWTIIPALLTANTVIFKPSEHSILVGKMIDEIINSIFPKGVFNTLYGNKRTGELLAKSNIDKLFFTGSESVGRNILKTIRPIPLSLEVGGKDASIVCDDASIELAVQGVIWGALNNAGQVCSSTERVYVHEKIANKFIERIVDEVKMLKIGRDVGPIINEKQLIKIEDQLKDAQSKNAAILFGGTRVKRKGFFLEPTILINVSDSMKIMKEETFGPIIPIMTFKTLDEAVKLANNSAYGLGVVIWTDNIKNGIALGNKINTGMVWINDVNTPLSGGDYWGGTRASGLRCSESKLMQCLKAKTFITYTGKTKRDWWNPYM